MKDLQESYYLLYYPSESFTTIVGPVSGSSQAIDQGKASLLGYLLCNAEHPGFTELMDRIGKKPRVLAVSDNPASLQNYQRAFEATQGEHE